MYDFKLSKNLKDDIKQIVYIDKANFINPWLEKQWIYEIKENPVSKVIGIKIDDEVVAYLDYWITFDSSTIAKIAVKEEFKRQGHASKLLEEMMKDLKANDVFYLTLEVRKSNEKAIKLYEKYGFKTITTKTAYYADGEDALYMIREVN